MKGLPSGSRFQDAYLFHTPRVAPFGEGDVVLGLDDDAAVRPDRARRGQLVCVGSTPNRFSTTWARLGTRQRERETERRDGRTRVRRCPEARACDGLRVVLVVVNGEDAVELVRDSIDGVPLGHGHWSEEPLFLNEPT